MGRFGATLLLLLSGACGDNLDGDGLGAGPNDDVNPAGNGDVIPRYIPQVCGVSSWTPSIGIDPATKLSVVSRPFGGATLMQVPLGGGDVFGFNLDPRMEMIGEGTKIEIMGSAVTASYVGNIPVSTSVLDGAVYVHGLDENLENPQLMTKIPGSFVAEPAFYHAQGNILMPVATDTGLVMHRFHDSLEPFDSKQFVTTAPARSITVAQLGSAMMTAWSTDTDCYMHVNTTYEEGVTARTEAACPSPRLSVNQTSGEGIMLFESEAGIRMMTIQARMMGGDARVLRADSTAPRTLFDGTNFWVSYLDPRGDVVVGFLDANRRPITMSLGDPRPDRQAYELVEVDGSPWVFSIDETGYTAYRMCVETVW